MPVSTAKTGLQAPQIISIDGPDQVEKGKEIQLRWKLGGGAAAKVTLDGKPVTGTSAKVKPLTDPTGFTLTVSNIAGSATALKWVGTHADTECVSGFLEVAAGQIGDDHPYRADTIDPAELVRVRRNLTLLGQGMPKVSGLRIKSDLTDLDNRLKKIRAGHTPTDTLTLTNAEFDRERAKLVWPHLRLLALGGRVQENHSYRIHSLDAAEIARVRKNIATLTNGLAKVPGFGGQADPKLDDKLKELNKKGANPAETLVKINKLFDLERQNVLQVTQKPGALTTPPFRATKVDPAELARVRKNIAALSAGLAKITGLGDSHDPGKLDTKTKSIKPKSSPAHTLDLINNEFDRERTAVITKHASKIHHGSGPGSQVLRRNHPFRIFSLDKAELDRVKENIAKLGAGLEKIPGFGGRFDPAEHERRLKGIKPGPTHADTIALYNKEFDWERNHMLQAQATPAPRPVHMRWAVKDAGHDHPYRVDNLDPAEIARVKKNFASLGAGLSKVTGVKAGHDPAGLDARLKAIRPGHTPNDAKTLINAIFDRERAKAMWPHLNHLAHGGRVHTNHTYRVHSLEAAEIERVKKNIATLTTGLAKIPGFGGRGDPKLEAKLKDLTKKGAKPADAIPKINKLFDTERQNVLQVVQKPAKPGAPVIPPFRVLKITTADINRVRNNLALLAHGLSKITGLSNTHSPTKVANNVRTIQPKATEAHTLEMINHQFDVERTAIISRHASKIHHGTGPGSKAPPKGHPYRVDQVTKAELLRVKKNLLKLHTGLAAVPGFGGRFNAAEHEKRLAAIKRGQTPQETTARVNAEFDWERNNMLQVHPKPVPRPPQKPAFAVKHSGHYHPYRIDHLEPAEMARVKKNFAALAGGLSQVTGIKVGHDPKGLDARLKAVRLGHTPGDTRTLINAIFDRERAKAMWPHMSRLAHGGAVSENHTYRIHSLAQADIDRVKKNMALLTNGLANIPGFGGKADPKLEGKIKDLNKKGAKPAEVIPKINALFDAERQSILQVVQKPAKPGAVVIPPFRVAKISKAEIDRVRKNLATLSAGLSKITGLRDQHNPKKVANNVRVIKPKATVAHTLEMINHQFDVERTSIISRHASKIHHGTGPGSKAAQKGHPYRIHQLNQAELQRVRKNMLAMHAGLSKIPGFGGRFNLAEHDKRMRNIKPGATHAETVARVNAELDWERNNMLQVHPKPVPRPPMLPASPHAGGTNNNHPYRVDNVSPKEMERVKKNFAALGAGLSKASGIKIGHNPTELEQRLKNVRKGHSPGDLLALVNAEFDRERTKVMWPHLGHFAYGGKVQTNHTYRAHSIDPKEVERVRKNMAALSLGLSKIPGFGGRADPKLHEKLKGVSSKKGPKPPETLAKINAIFQRERENLLQVYQKPPAPGAKVIPPFRATKTDAAELARVRKNLAALSAGLAKVTGLPDGHAPARLENTLKTVKPKASHVHTLDMINFHFDRERTLILGRHVSKIHHGAGAGSKAVQKNHPYRAHSLDKAELERVKKSIANLGNHLSKIPGFGKRFDPKEHERRIKSIKPGKTPVETLARYNAEFDWERTNMLQAHTKPPPRPVQKAA